MIEVFIFSDVCLYREGLAGIVAGAAGMTVNGAAGSTTEMLELLARTPAHVALLDLATPQALETAQRLATRFPQLRLVALGVLDERGAVLACAEVGITGYVCRNGSAADLAEAIRCAAAGELRCSIGVAGALIERLAVLSGSRGFAPSSLTRRETQVVRLVDEGLTNKEIATRLHIAAATARNHVHSILEKREVRTRAGAAAKARRPVTNR